MRLGDLARAEDALHRALDVRSPIQFHETTGAVFDTLAQIHLMRGRYEMASEFLARAGEAYGAYGRQTSQWYEWSVRVLGARLALRRGALDEAVTRADEILRGRRPAVRRAAGDADRRRGAAFGGRLTEAEQRLASAADDAGSEDGAGGVGRISAAARRARRQEREPADAYHDFAQSATLLDLLGERYQAGLSHLALGRLVAHRGARSVAERHLAEARSIFQQLGAERDLADTQDAERLLTNVRLRRIRHLAGGRRRCDRPANRRRGGAARTARSGDRRRALRSSGSGPRGRLRSSCPMATFANCRLRRMRCRWRAHTGAALPAPGAIVRPRHASSTRAARPRSKARGLPPSRLRGRSATPWLRRVRMIATVARQGYALCAARDRSSEPQGAPADHSLEPLLPGFLSASAAMTRVVEQIQRLQGNDLTVLITGESGTGKELVARAIHVGSHRSAAMFLPYNCTTTGRELADSQLFGHRRGSFTGAVADQPGLVRSAAGGTLFLDEIGDLPLDVQPKLLRFLEQHEIMPVGESRPQRVDVRVLAATNADLEQRVAEGKFREDLYYRLSVIRIHVPPLRERREEIPHLSTFFLREASERLGKPDIQLSSGALDAFSQVLVAGKRAAAEERNPARGGDERPGRDRRAGTPVTRNRLHQTARRRRNAPHTVSGRRDDVGVSRGANRAGSDSGGIGPDTRQHLRDRSDPRPHAARLVPQIAASRVGIRRRLAVHTNSLIGYKVNDTKAVRILCIHSLIYIFSVICSINC